MAKALRACDHCTKYKRRCDKVMPECGHCKKLRRGCVYSSLETENVLLRQKIVELETLLAATQTISPAISTLTSSSHLSEYLSPSKLQHQKLFLDSDLQAQVDVPHVQREPVSVPSSVLDEVGGPEQRTATLKQYFDGVHQWMPFMSKWKRERLLRTSNALRADHLFLLLCMKLVLSIPRDPSDASTCRLYTIAKELASTIECSGFYSLASLQGFLLVTVYEMGHGILPAAYISTGKCATLAVALGIHDEKAPQMLEKLLDRVEWEERLRTWWMVRILDRYITAGGDHRPLFTEDPSPSAHLPGCDASWDRGEMTTPDTMLLSSSEDISASPFARVAQAAHILGQVIKHCNRNSVDLEETKQNVELLSKIANSLLGLLTRNHETVLRFHSAISLCLSALLKLYDNHSCDSFVGPNRDSLGVRELALQHEITQFSVQGLKVTTTRVISFQKTLQSRLDATDCEPVSPLILNCFYRTSIVVTWLSSATSPDDEGLYAANKRLCVDVLGKVSRRWKVTHAYLEALSIAENGLEAGVY